MIPDLVITAVIALLSSSLFFGLLQMMMIESRNALERTSVEQITQRAQDVADRLNQMAAQCRYFAPDNSIRCTHNTGHTGLHSDGSRSWYGNVWFPNRIGE